MIASFRRLHVQPCKIRGLFEAGLHGLGAQPFLDVGEREPLQAAHRAVSQGRGRGNGRPPTRKKKLASADFCLVLAEKRWNSVYQRSSAAKAMHLCLSAVFSAALLLGRAGVRTSRAGTPTAASIAVPEASQLAQLARMTTLSIDTGDLDIIKAYGATGLITDATTNPLFVSQAGLSGDARYIAFVDSAIAYAKKNAKGTEAVLELAMDRLAVELGLEIVKLVPGYVSTEVDIRASFDTAESIARARRIIAMYEAAGVPRTRVLVKLAGTWEGIQAAKVLEKEGITCNITLIFGFIQAVAAAQAGARLSTGPQDRIRDRLPCCPAPS